MPAGILGLYSPTRRHPKKSETDPAFASNSGENTVINVGQCAILLLWVHIWSETRPCSAVREVRRRECTSSFGAARFEQDISHYSVAIATAARERTKGS